MDCEPGAPKEQDVTKSAWRNAGHWRIVLGPLLMFWAAKTLLVALPPTVNQFERAGQLIAYCTVPALLFLGGAWLVYSHWKRRRENPD